MSLDAASMPDDTRKRTHEGSNKMATESTPTETLSKHGDVVLHVGKAPQKERKLLVSSAQLSFASPVFAAMFNGRFAEGQSLTSDSPRLVALPEDDADAMATVCTIIHLQIIDLGVTTTPNKLASIAIVANKYDCVEAVRSWSIIWMANILKAPSAADFESALLTTYLLDMAPEFLKVSKSLIRDRSELFSAPAMSHGQHFLSEFVLEYIIKARDHTQKMALAALDPLAAGMECNVLRKDTAFFFSELRRTGLWPIRQLSVAQIKAGLGQIKNPTAAKCTGQHLCKCISGRADIKSVLADVTKIYNTVEGLCLDCVKKLELDIDCAKCRVDCNRTLVPF